MVTVVMHVYYVENRGARREFTLATEDGWSKGFLMGWDKFLEAIHQEFNDAISDGKKIELTFDPPTFEKRASGPWHDNEKSALQYVLAGC